MSKPRSVDQPPLLAVVMGSRSDWDTMRHAVDVLVELSIPHHVEVVSAHRTPDRLYAFAAEAEAQGLRGIIAGAGGAAHLPGMLAAKTTVPVYGVPVATAALGGLDSLYSIVQMPGGIPVATFAIGKAGATNAALAAAAAIAHADRTRLGARLRAALARHRAALAAKVAASNDPRLPDSAP